MTYYCSECRKPNPDIVERDYGYGVTEYWGATSCDVNIQQVSKCCEGDLVEEEDE